MTDEALLQDLERKPLFQFHSRGAEDGPDGSCRSALLSDYFAEVALSHSQLKNSCLFTFNRPHRNLVGIVHKSFRDLFDELLHSCPPNSTLRFRCKNQLQVV